MANLVHNERVKMAAMFFNNTGVASFGVGAVLRLFGGTESQPASLLAVGACMFFGLVCLGGAYRMLGDLKE